MRIYMMEAAFLQRLRDDRKEILAFARALGTADEMRKAREDLMAGTRINLAPKAGDDLSKLYTVDTEGIAHIPMLGELTPAARQDACGAYTAEALTEYGFLEAAIRAAENDPRVSTIALDANTPGGYTDGVDMVAQSFAAASKPTMAIVADSMQSAGYYIGSQADRIVALSPMSKVGSIGVALEEMDDTRKLAEAGIDRHVYTSTDAPDKRPDTSTEEGRAKMIAYADGLQRVFTDRVAQGRNTTAANVRANFGRGATVMAQDALARGMIDEIRGMDISRKPAGVAGEQTAAKADGTLKTGGAKTMTLEELKRDHPDLYAAVFSAGEASGKVKGVTEGVTQERARVTALEKWIAADAGNEKVSQIVAEAKTTGKAEADVLAQLQVAVRDGKTEVLDPDNPPAVRTQGGNGTVVSDEAVRMGAKMGVTAADIAKFGGAPRKE